MNIRLLFSDAELGEDLAEDFVGGDLAGDGAEGGEGGAEVLRQEVGGDAAVEAVGDGDFLNEESLRDNLELFWHTPVNILCFLE